MRLVELMSIVDETRPNQYSNTLKIKWINEVEHKVVEEVINKSSLKPVKFEPYVYETDSEKMLLVPDQYDDVYITYVYSKMDFTNGETARYNNDAAMFEAAWGEYAAWHKRTYGSRGYRLPEPIEEIDPEMIATVGEVSTYLGIGV